MINQIKKMRKMKTSQEVLNRLEFIQRIRKAEGLKTHIGLDNNYEAYLKLETITYKIAIKKANTIDEIEKCAVSVEEEYIGNLDPDAWADEIRIKAYGLSWFLNKTFSSPAYKEFENFIEQPKGE